MDINPADVIVVVVVVVSGIFAFARGFVQELLSLGAWIGAGVATYYGIDLAIPFARQLTANQPLADIGAGTAIFLAVLVALSIVTRIIVRQVRRSSLGALDRSLGLLFGLVRGAVLVSIAWLIAAWAYQDQEIPPWIAEAKALPLVQAGARELYEALPEGLRPEDMPKGLDPAAGGAPITFETFDTPTPKATAQEERSGYKDDERKGLEGLFEQSQ